MAGTPPPKLVSPAIFHIAITMTMIIMAAFLSESPVIAVDVLCSWHALITGARCAAH
jgi:hypothetical protein